MKIIAKTFQGLEAALAEEVRGLGVSNVQIGKRAVFYEGDQELLYRSNYLLRTAVRILVEINYFKIHSFDDLYHKIYHIDWPSIFQLRDTFAVDAVTNSQFFKHSKYAALKTKDGIVDRFRSKYQRRPDVDTKNPTVRIHIHINERDATLALDSSGDPLFRRGYRVKGGDAPLNEVLAAGILKLAGWDLKQDFLDPMCGSGTFPIEAMMMAAQVSPQVMRKNFGFRNWADYNHKLWMDVIRKDKAQWKLDQLKTIEGKDHSDLAIDRAIEALDGMRLSSTINFNIADFFSPQESNSDGKFIIMNPPYNKRLELDDEVAFYQKIGDTLKQNYQNSEAWIFSGALEGIKHVGLKPTKKIHLLNGSLESKLHQFSIY